MADIALGPKMDTVLYMSCGHGAEYVSTHTVPEDILFAAEHTPPVDEHWPEGLRICRPRFDLKTQVNPHSLSNRIEISRKIASTRGRGWAEKTSWVQR